MGDRVEILGVKVDRLDSRGFEEQIEAFVLSGKKHKVMYANVHSLNSAWEDPELRRILNSADLLYCDGAGVKLGARLLGKELPERMTGADWIYDLSEMCEAKGISTYLLGGEPGVAANAAERLKSLYPRLAIAGTHHGYFNDDAEVVEKINERKPDILFVGLGTPLQERWIENNFAALDVAVVWGVGALVDFVAGKVPRAPRWMLDHGMEWLFRLMVEPRRMWRRYLIGNPLFILRVLKQRFTGDKRKER